MGFFDSIFGNGGRGLIIEDKELGSFKSIVAKGEKVVWKGHVKFLNHDIELLISGDKEQLNASEKKSLSDVLKDEANIENQINEGLKEEYDNADKEYTNWAKHFKLNSISTNTSEVQITFEEKESLYHFNLNFVNNKLIGTSIDS